MSRDSPRFHSFVLLISGVAALKIAAGVSATVWILSTGRAVPGASYPGWIFLILILGFGSAAALLIHSGRSDRRAGSLGVSLLLVASLFGDRALLALSESSLLFALPARLQLSALLPYFLWTFAHDFPRAPAYDTTASLIRSTRRLALAIGVLLFVANLVPAGGSNLGRLLRMVARHDDTSYYWEILVVLNLLALVVILRRTRTAGRTERRRVRLFVGGLVLGSAPVALAILAIGLSDRFSQILSRQPASLWAGLLVYSSLLSIPALTAYSVLVDRVLDLRLVLRSAMQYGLARYAILAWTTLPVLALVAIAYRGRHESLAALLSGPRSYALGLVIALGFLAMRRQATLLESLDRRFFRDKYDANKILADLTESARHTTTAEELSELLSGEIDRALHLETIAVLTADHATGAFCSTGRRVRPLAIDSSLARMVAQAGGPFEIDMNQTQPAGFQLPDEDRYWVADGGFTLLVPLLSSRDTLLGMLCLGEKRSELPFSKEDRLLLRAIAASGAAALEHTYIVSTGWAQTPDAASAVATGGITLTEPSAAVPASQPPTGAAECSHCGMLQRPETEHCERCGGSTTEAAVPLLLAGKFRLLERLGAGGMGIVYKATDTSLGRPVAIKVLPRVSPKATLRFRREARTMATFVHPHLALIFAAESWLGTPILVVEYLSGGTLDRLLTRRSYGELDAIELGIALAEATTRLHAAGVLHRDIKPSNIGFTSDGTPKLLDFGLARVMTDSSDVETAEDVESPVESPSSANATWTLLRLSGKRQIAGTPLYMSPEAAAGRRPAPDFDLWSLAMTLYEVVARRHPIAGKRPDQVLGFLRSRPIPSIREHVPDCSAALEAFFDQALAADRRSRLTDTITFKARLLEARQALRSAN